MTDTERKMISKVETTVRSLRENGFTVEYFEDKDSAKKAVLADIAQSESVGLGGSVTAAELGLYQALKDRGTEVYSHNNLEEGQNKKEIQKKAMVTDVYITSSNGITEDGRLVNIDGVGNRLSGMLFGHDRLYIIAGINKISKNYDESMVRIKNIACPQNARRLNLKTPCSTENKCMNCSSSDRICNATLVIERQPLGEKIIIYIVNEHLGY